MSAGNERVSLPAARFEEVLARFVRDGRLAVIPSKRSHKLVVFAWLVRRFEEGRRYPEREVNARIAEAHPDFATIRRGLYDEFFMNRENGAYWRTPDAQKLVIEGSSLES